MNMRSWYVVQEICKMKSKNEIVRVEDEIVTLYAKTSYHKLSSKGQEKGPKTLREIQTNVH